MEKINWTYRVKNRGVLHRVKEERNILRTIKWKNLNWIGHILRWNCVLKDVVERKVELNTEGTWRQGRRRKQLLDGFKETIKYWSLRETTLDRTFKRTHLGRNHGPVASRLRNEWM